MKKVPILLLLLSLMVFSSQCFVMALDGSTINSWSSSKKSAQKLRIIALNSDSLEALRILNAQDMVVGIVDTIAQEKEFWGNLADLPMVGSWNEPNYEKIYSLKPNLALTYQNTPGPELERKLPGIRILRLDFYKPSSLARAVWNLGEILHRPKRAKEFIGWYQKKLDHIRAKVSKSWSSPRVYMECYSAYHALGPGSGGYQMCELAGGNSISSEFSIPYPRITPEWVMSKQPEVIIKTASINGYSKKSDEALKKIWQRVMSRPGWKNINALKNKRVYVLASDICAGPRAIVGIAYMAKWFYPKGCAELDPGQIHRNYLEKFQDIACRGCYTWPPVNSGQ